MKFVRTFAFYPLLFFSTVFLGIMASIIGFVFHRSDLAHLCGRIWGNFNLWVAGVKVEIDGLENVDPAGSCVYASNHQSVFDIFAILGKLPVQFRWLAKEELFKLPILGLAMTSIGYIPIDRGDRRKAFESLRLAAEKVKGGTSIVIFPEGTRSVDGVLGEFKKGGFILAMQSRRPIVPVTISGSHRILPKLGRLAIQPGGIRLSIGKPIPTAGLENKDRNALLLKVREAIRTQLPISEGGMPAG